MAFASARQRKKVMAILRGKGFHVRPKKISLEKNFYRARIEQPSKFKPGSFRTLDVGKKGGIEIVRAKPKNSDKFKTQTILVEKSLVENRR